LVVAGLGSPSWDVFAAGDHVDYFYAWGGMGLAVPLALGLALAQPKRRVLAVTGDGEMLMGIGSLAVVGDQAPGNLAILVLDNESFAETGGQRGLTAKAMDIAGAARGFGIRRTLTMTGDGVEGLAKLLFEGTGPALAVAKVAVSKDPLALPEKDGAAIAHRFRGALGLGGA
jgi:phosphonopyruvate decarboxylase